MRPEYDFSEGVRGKHAGRYASGTNVVVLAPDVASQFPTADDVNDLPHVFIGKEGDHLLAERLTLNDPWVINT